MKDGFEKECKIVKKPAFTVIGSAIVELHHGRLMLSREREGYAKSFVIMLETKYE